MGWAGFLSMALFRIPLFFYKQISFWKLLGCGKNGSFDIRPDWHQWSILTVTNELPVMYKGSNAENNYKLLYGHFIQAWWKLFSCKTYTFILEPIEGHGMWDGKEVFGKLHKETDYTGKIAVLTRATIRLRRLKNFWKHIDITTNEMRNADGFITSIGIGEIPWKKQATFSVWESKEKMKQFAYKMYGHTEVIRKTREEKWYSEEMFVRFTIIDSFGAFNLGNTTKPNIPDWINFH